MKKILAGISILFVLLALAAAVAPYLMDLDRYKGVALGALKPYLSREVDFEHMELTVLTGLGVKIEGLTVSENPSFGDGDFLRLEKLELRVRMIPLLRKQMKIRRVLLRRPVVRLTRNAGGEFNFSDLFKGGKPPDDGSNQETLPVTGVSSHTRNVQGALAVSVINDLEVQEGRVTYQDENLFPGAAPVLIDRLDLRAQDLSLQETATLELAAGLAGAPEQNLHLSARTEPVDGTVAWQRLRMSVKIKIDSLPVGLVPAVWLAGLPAKPASGDLTLTLEAHGSFAEQIQSAVDLACKGLVLEVPRGGEMIERSGAFELAVSQRGTYDPAQQQVTIESGTVVLNGGTVLVKGFVGKLFSIPEWDLELWTQGLEPSAVLDLFPMYFTRVRQLLLLEGPGELRLKSSGTLENLKFEAQMNLEDLGLRYRGTFQKPAGVPLLVQASGSKEGRRITISELRCTLHQLSMGLSGDVVAEQNPVIGLVFQTEPVPLAGWEPLVPSVGPFAMEGSLFLRGSLRGSLNDASANWQLSSDRIAFRLPSSRAPVAGDRPRSAVLEELTVDGQLRKRVARIEASGTVEARKGELFTAPFETLLSSLEYVPGRVNVTGLECRAFGGTVQARGSYEPGAGVWKVQPLVKGVSLDGLMNRLTPYRDIFSGVLSGDFEFQGQKEGQVRANGDFRISRGELRNLALADAVMDDLLQIKEIARLPDGRGTKGSRSAVTRFDWLQGRFQSGAGRVHFEPLQLRNVSTSRFTDVDALLQGEAPLGPEALDMKGRIILSRKDSQELTRRAKVLDAFLNPEGRMMVPFSLHGTLQKPIPSVDAGYVSGVLSKYFARKGIQKGLERLQGDRGRRPDKDQPVERPMGELLRELIP